MTLPLSSPLPLGRCRVTVPAAVTVAALPLALALASVDVHCVACVLIILCAPRMKNNQLNIDNTYTHKSTVNASV